MRIATRLTIVGVLGVALLGAGGSVIFGAPPASDIPASKLALESFAAANQKNAFKADKSKDPGRPLVIQTDPPAHTGLLGQVGAPIPGDIFTPENAWADWTDATTYVQVYAGDTPDQPGHGAVFVVRRHGSGGVIDPEIPSTSALITPPSLGGPLRIVRFEGGEVVVANPGGHEFRFNPVSSAFD